MFTKQTANRVDAVPYYGKQIRVLDDLISAKFDWKQRSKKL